MSEVKKDYPPSDKVFRSIVDSTLLKIGIDIKKVKEPEFFYMALTHKSFTWKWEVKYNYQYLEFLGDAVLELYVSDRIFRNFPNYDEGAATRHRQKIVANEVLYNVAYEIGLTRAIRVGKNVFTNSQRQGRIKIFSDITESFIGAMYVSLGIDVTFERLDRILLKKILERTTEKDPKSIFQEIIQTTGTLSRLRYVTSLQANGEFKADLYVDEKLFGTGQGKSKKTAEKFAAINALKKMGVAKI